MSMKKIVTTLGAVGALALSFLAVPVSAQFSYSAVGGVTGADTSSLNVGTITNTVANIANIIIGIIAAVSVFYIIWGAIQWMNGKADEGQKTVVNAVIGLIVAILAFFIARFAVGAGTFLNTQLK